MNNHDGSKNGRDRGSSLLSYVRVRHVQPAEGLESQVLTGLLRGEPSTTEAPPSVPEAENVQQEAAELAKTPTQAAYESEQFALPVTVPAAAKDAGHSTAEVGEVDAAGTSMAAGLLALAQKLHNEYVAEGQSTREELISEGQLRHDQVIGEATARHDELCSTGQAKHDRFVSVGEARHDALISEAETLLAEAHTEHEHIMSEARRLSTIMVVEAEQRKAEVLQGLSQERRVLQQEIEDLRIFEHDDRARLKSYHQGQLSELENVGADETDGEPV